MVIETLLFLYLFLHNILSIPSDPNFTVSSNRDHSQESYKAQSSVEKIVGYKKHQFHKYIIKCTRYKKEWFGYYILYYSVMFQTSRQCSVVCDTILVRGLH